MPFATITGWGNGLPPAVLTNEDLSTFLDTSDEWITTRTGMKERRISHVSAIEMATLASARALACAGLDAADVDLIIYGGCSNEEAVPNSASGVQALLGATRAAAMDVNTACTSFLYGLSTATSMIRTGVVRNAVVIGVELISRYMDWSNRNVAVLFGDGAAAVVLQATDQETGVLASVLGCDAEARASLYRLGRARFEDQARRAQAAGGDVSRLLDLAAAWPSLRMPVDGHAAKAAGATDGLAIGRALKAFEAEWIAADFPETGHAERLARIVREQA